MGNKQKTISDGGIRINIDENEENKNNENDNSENFENLNFPSIRV